MRTNGFFPLKGAEIVLSAPLSISFFGLLRFIGAVLELPKATETLRNKRLRLKSQFIGHWQGFKIQHQLAFQLMAVYLCVPF